MDISQKQIEFNKRCLYCMQEMRAINLVLRVEKDRERKHKAQKQHLSIIPKINSTKT